MQPPPATCHAALQKFPRARLAHAPTPLHKLSRLSAACAPHNLFVKRDDCTGLAFGGNKARHLEFYLGAAVARGCDTVLGTGAVQSNHVRMLSAAAAQLGLECHAQLETRVANPPPDYRRAGNAFLNYLAGAKVRHFAYAGADQEAAADREIDQLALRLAARGKTPYPLHSGKAYAHLGALGYVAAALELAEQIQQQSLDIHLIAVASGGGATHAGLLVGLRWLQLAMPVVGVCVCRAAAAQRARVLFIAQNLAAMLGAPAIAVDDVWTEDTTLAPGYGHTAAPVLDDIRRLARAEGLLTDPIYSGKTFSYVLQSLRADALSNYRNILIIHTGGVPALFAHANLFAAAQ